MMSDGSLKFQRRDADLQITRLFQAEASPTVANIIATMQSVASALTSAVPSPADRYCFPSSINKEVRHHENKDADKRIEGGRKMKTKENEGR